MMNSAPGYTLPRVTACLHFMESALTSQWDSHYHASEQETISANLGIYGYIMAKYLRNMGLKCYLGGLFPTFFAFSVNRCVIFPSLLSPVTARYSHSFLCPANFLVQELRLENMCGADFISVTINMVP